jgi:hypothetical protein
MGRMVESQHPEGCKVQRVQAFRFLLVGMGGGMGRNAA